MICHKLTRVQSNEVYRQVTADKDSDAARLLCATDLFFLLTVACKRRDIDRDWLYERCREVEASPDGHLDLWSRDHYKSSIITFGKTIEDLLADSDNTIGIFSHTRPIAKGFLAQIKRELETNSFLKNLFPDRLWQNPEKESPQWSLDGGIILKRKSNPKEASVEAWGLVDGQPTSKHFKIRVYDDVVTRESVTTPEQIKKTTEAWELSQNLGTEGGKARYIGTRYHSNDTYKTILERGSASPRIHPATDNGKMDGEPVLLTKKALEIKRRDMGPYTFSCQMLQNPVADKAMSFKSEWLKHYEKVSDSDDWNKYLLVDPSSGKKKTSDNTVMVVIGLAPDNNYYLLDGVRDRLNLTQRTEKLFELHRKHSPNAVAYEEYGMQADIEHIQYVMEEKNYRFNITPLGGQLKKEDRILKLVPIFEQNRFWMPKLLTFISQEGMIVDFVKAFTEDEYLAFPVLKHDDMLDCVARILDPDLGAEFPKIQEKVIDMSHYQHSGGWMS